MGGGCLPSSKAALASTEPEGSANFAAPADGVRTGASPQGGDWVINGAKQWISSATSWDGKGADLISIVCRTDPTAQPKEALSIIVAEQPIEGIMLEKALNAFGHRAHLVPRFRIENMRVPKKNTLGNPGTGLKLVEDRFTGTVPLVGAFELSLHARIFSSEAAVKVITDLMRVVDVDSYG